MKGNILGFDASPALSGLRGFQQRTVAHVFKRFYLDPDPAERFLVADETGLGKSMVARGVIAKVIERLDYPESSVDRIDIVYVCSNADLAKQNLARLNVTGQRDIIESGRLTLLPTQLAKLNAPAAPGTNKRINFISLTPGTSFNTGTTTGQARERAVLFRMLEQLGVIEPDTFDDAVELMRATSGSKGFRWHLDRLKDELCGGFPNPLPEQFRILAERSGNLATFRNALYNAKLGSSEDRRRQMNPIISGLRGDLARASLDALEPDLVILDEFQRFRDLLRTPAAGSAEVDPAADLARDFLNYKGAKLLLLSATPYKAHTGTNDAEDDDHAADFRQLLRFLSKERPEYIETLTRDLDIRRAQILQQLPDDGVTQRLEDQLKLFMTRTERPQLGADDMLAVVEMAPTDVRATDLVSYKSMSALFHAARTGNPMEYWKSVPMFAHFLTDYKIGKMLDGRIQCDRKLLDPILPTLTTIDPETYRRYGAIPTDNAKYRAVRELTIGQGWWQLLWVPPSLPYIEPAGVFAKARQNVTKQVVFSAWNAAPTALTTLLSYEADRKVLEDSKLHSENSAEARRRFRGLLRYRVVDDRAATMSTLALFVPHIGLATAADPFAIASAEGNPVSAASALETVTVSAQKLAAARLVEDLSRLGPWASYFSTPGCLPKEWTEHISRARSEILSVVVEADGSDEEVAKEGAVSGNDSSHYKRHIDQLLETVRGPFTGWDEAVADLALNSPANCAFRAFKRVVGDEFDVAEIWKASLVASAGLRTLFNRLDTAELLGVLYPEGDYWQKVLSYCSDGNLQAVLDEYVFQLRSQQSPGPVTAEQLRELGDIIRHSLSLKPARMLAKYPDKSNEDLRMGVRFAVRYSNARTDDGDSNRMPDVRRAFNSPFWPFVLASTSVGQEGIDFHWWAHSVIHWNVPSNPVDFEQREGRVHRYLGHAVRKNVAEKHGTAVFKPGVTNPWQSLFDIASAHVAALPDDAAKEFAPQWIHRGRHKIQRRLLDHPLSRDVLRTKQMLAGLANYRLTLGQARQDDLLGFIKDDTDLKPLNLMP